MVEHFSSMHEALGAISSMTKKMKKSNNKTPINIPFINKPNIHFYLKNKQVLVSDPDMELIARHCSKSFLSVNSLNARGLLQWRNCYPHVAVRKGQTGTQACQAGPGVGG